MSEVRVNDQRVQLEIGQKTWGDVLATVDGRAAAEGHVVTAVRFGGVDQPSFRDETVTAEAAAGAGVIEVETVPRARLVKTTLGTAGLSLHEIAGGASRAATAFRLGDTAEGHRQLGAVLATVRTLVELTLATAATANADLYDLSCGDESAANVLGATGVVLDTLAQYQRAQDWVALADELEYALAPSILSWSTVFVAIEERSAA